MRLMDYRQVCKIVYKVLLDTEMDKPPVYTRRHRLVPDCTVTCTINSLYNIDLRA